MENFINYFILFSELLDLLDFQWILVECLINFYLNLAVLADIVHVILMIYQLFIVKEIILINTTKQKIILIFLSY
jgi:hypothetical protein